MLKHNRQIAPLAFGVIATILLVITAISLLNWQHFQVLRSAGSIAEGQRNLLFTATGLMLLIVIPVLGLTFGIAWKYRATNQRSSYQPDWDHNRRLEAIWWGFPILIITILATMTWHSTHQFDPSRALVSDRKPLTIQVVALQWKWLFIYPQQNFATVNYVKFPVDQPVRFEITADAPMNSFWIPRLGGQIYAMPGMVTKLNLKADQAGSYPGSSANISGTGFTEMRFTAEAAQADDFTAWVRANQRAANPLTNDSYERLARPAVIKNPPSFSSVDSDIFDNVVRKGMTN
jgi:cytochrome o ubiquinol oxidase subunit 2